MAELAVLVPSRGRPQQLRDMAQAVRATATGDVLIAAGFDNDDDSDYTQAADGLLSFTGPRKSLCGWTNELAHRLLNSHDPPLYLASLGDDHRPRTPGWDRILIDAIEQMDGPGIAYGNDLLQGKAMPTAWVASADLVRALGWMMLPGCAHMYVDNAILALGTAAGRLAYRPDAVIEHLHPLAGKAAWDDSYRESNATERYTSDRDAFEDWRRTQLGHDAATVAALTFPHLSTK